MPLQAELTLPLPTGAGGTSAQSGLINSGQKQVPGSPDAAGIDVIRTRFAVTASEPTLVVDLKANPDLLSSPTCLSKAPGMEFRRRRKSNCRTPVRPPV